MRRTDMRVAEARVRNTTPLCRSNESPARFRFVGCSSVPDAHIDLSSVSISRAIFQPRVNTDKGNDSSFRVQKSVKIRVHPWLSSSAFLIAHRKSPCRRAPASRPPQLRWRNRPSYPLRDAEALHQILFRARHAARAIAQRISANPPPLARVGGLSSTLRSTVAEARAAIPFSRAHLPA